MPTPSIAACASPRRRCGSGVFWPCSLTVDSELRSRLCPSVRPCFQARSPTQVRAPKTPNPAPTSDLLCRSRPAHPSLAPHSNQPQSAHTSHLGHWPIPTHPPTPVAQILEPNCSPGPGPTSLWARKKLRHPFLSSTNRRLDTIITSKTLRPGTTMSFEVRASQHLKLCQLNQGLLDNGPRHIPDEVSSCDCRCLNGVKSPSEQHGLTS